MRHAELPTTTHRAARIGPGRWTACSLPLISGAQLPGLHEAERQADPRPWPGQSHRMPQSTIWSEQLRTCRAFLGAFLLGGDRARPACGFPLQRAAAG